MQKEINKSNLGFSLIELMVVVAIIGILAAIIGFSYAGVTDRAAVNSLQSDLNGASDQLRVDQTNDANGNFPVNTTGLKASPGTTYPIYQYNNASTPKTFCLTATNATRNLNYNINQEGVLSSGICPAAYFDPSIATSYSGQGNTIYDLSGNGDNGTMTAGVGYSKINGGALSFDGVAQDRVTVSGLAGDITNKFSAEVWVNSRDVTMNQTVLSQNGPFFIRISGSRFRVGIYTGAWLLTNGTKPLSNNTWHHLVLTYDGASVKSYVDGESDLDVAKTGNMVAFTSMYIGYPPNAGEQYVMNGYVGLARIYKYCLSKTEVSNNFNSLRGQYGR